MSWHEHAVWWHVYPLGFLGAPGTALPEGADPVHRLTGLETWLDYLVELGCNGLALGPVFASETHGYDTVDHYRVDPRLGTEDDLCRLVERARAHGVHVLLDGVFNHVGRTFPAFGDVTTYGRESRYASWFRPLAEGDSADTAYETFEGHERLVAFNHDNPEVAAYVADVMAYWLDRGVSGWRLDAAYAVPTTFWADVSRRVRERFPDAWLIGEVIHGDYPAFITEGGLDSVTQYELWKAIWSSLGERNFWELDWALGRHNEFLDTFVPYTFVGNHDVTRIASRLDDIRHLEHALVLLFTVGGVPSVYAGDEQAFRGVKEEREGGDDAIRPAFPPDPDGLAPEGWPTYRLHQRLIGFRRRHPWLVRAKTRTVSLTNETYAFTTGADGEAVAVVLNVDGAPTAVELPPGDWRPALGAGEVDGAGVTVPGHGWAVLVSGTGV